MAQEPVRPGAPSHRPVGGDGAAVTPQAASEAAEVRLHEGVIFVLVQPQHPGNVGAVARAMKNMGLRRLVIVDPPPSFDMERARWMAPGAADLLADMRIVATLDEALDGVHRVVATTARHRSDGQPVHEPAGFATSVFDAPSDHVTAVLFGREDDGLSRASTLRCESLLRIATDHHASLNLGQAALLVGHHLFEEARRRGLRFEGRLVGGRRPPRATRSLTPGVRRATVTEIEPAVEELVTLLNRVGFTKANGPERVGVTVRELLQRSGVSERQIAAVRGMVGRIQYALDHPEVDWQASRADNARRST